LSREPHISSHFAFTGYFSARVLCFCQGQYQTETSYLYLPHSWDDRYTPERCSLPNIFFFFFFWCLNHDPSILLLPASSSNLLLFSLSLSQDFSERVSLCTLKLQILLPPHHQRLQANLLFFCFLFITVLLTSLLSLVSLSYFRL
jgi:hypothetical protein